VRRAHTNMGANRNVLGEIFSWAHIDPTKEVFAQFKANDRPGPIHMLNLVRLRAQAAYPRRPQGDRR